MQHFGTDQNIIFDRGKSLRVQLLNNEHAKANEASEQMVIPIVGSALVFIGIILTPLVMNLFTV